MSVKEKLAKKIAKKMKVSEKVAKQLLEPIQIDVPASSAKLSKKRKK